MQPNINARRYCAEPRATQRRCETTRGKPVRGAEWVLWDRPKRATFAARHWRHGCSNEGGVGRRRRGQCGKPAPCRGGPLPRATRHARCGRTGTSTPCRIDQYHPADAPRSGARWRAPCQTVKEAYAVQHGPFRVLGLGLAPMASVRVQLDHPADGWYVVGLTDICTGTRKRRGVVSRAVAGTRTRKDGARGNTTTPPRHTGA